MSERTFFNQGNILVTDKRAVLAGKTYSMANVTSVRMGVVYPSTTGAWLLVAFGATLLALAAFFLLGCGSSAIGNPNGATITSTLLCAGTPGFAGLICLVAGLVWARSLKPTYTVRIGSASGEVDGMRSQRKDVIEEVVAAINQAFIERA